MNSSNSSWIKQHSVVVYFIFACAITWAFEIPLVAVKQGWTQLPIPFAIHYLGAFGPMLAAIIVTGITQGRSGMRELFSGSIKWRISWGYAFFAILSPVVLFLIAMVVMRLVNGEWIDIHLLGQVNYLPYLGWGVLPVWLATFGFGEEIGWRGYALPRLQKTMSVSKATFLLGLLWITWHVPSFFYHDTYVGLGWIMLPGLIFSVLCGAVLLTWLYNGTGGSVLMVAIWHALFDLLTASKAGQDIIPIVTSAGVILWALFVANVNKPWGFRFQQKHTL